MAAFQAGSLWDVPREVRVPPASGGTPGFPCHCRALPAHHQCVCAGAWEADPADRETTLCVRDGVAKRARGSGALRGISAANAGPWLHPGVRRRRGDALARTCAHCGPGRGFCMPSLRCAAARSWSLRFAANPDAKRCACAERQLRWLTVQWCPPQADAPRPTLPSPAATLRFVAAELPPGSPSHMDRRLVSRQWARGVHHVLMPDQCGAERPWLCVPGGFVCLLRPPAGVGACSAASCALPRFAHSPAEPAAQAGAAGRGEPPQASL